MLMVKSGISALATPTLFHLFQHLHYVSQAYSRPGICIYNSIVALRNCGGRQITQKCQFLLNIALKKTPTDHKSLFQVHASKTFPI